MKNKVLYLSYDGMTDPLGQSQVLPYLTGLSKEGFEFHLISFEKPEKLQRFRAEIELICKQAGIIWHPLTYTKKPVVLSTLWDVFRMNRKAIQLHKSHLFKIVHCRSYISGLIGLGMKKKHNTRFVFDMRGFWADERIEGGIWSRSNPFMNFIFKYFKKKEIQFFSHADYVISLTENGKNELLSWKTLNAENINVEVIPCCVNMDLFDQSKILALQVNQLKNQLGISNNDFVLGYVGSIGTWYMLPEMLDYFKVLKQSRPESKFLFVTGENPADILNLAEQKGITPDALIVVSCLHKAVPLYISLFDQSVFFIRATYSKKASSPTKQGEIMAMGIPLVCNSGVGDTDYIVQKYNSGEVIKEFTDKAYQKVIDSKKTFDKQLLREGAASFFSLENGVERYLKVYKAIL